jgi:hypothetical protein
LAPNVNKAVNIEYTIITGREMHIKNEIKPTIDGLIIQPVADINRELIKIQLSKMAIWINILYQYVLIES